VAQLLYLSAGITRRRKYSGGENLFSARLPAPGRSTKLSFNLVCGELGGLRPRLSFRSCRVWFTQAARGDYRGPWVEATGGEAAIAHAPLTINLYLHVLAQWHGNIRRDLSSFRVDNGTLLANLVAVATALGLPAKVVCGFRDASVNRLPGCGYPAGRWLFRLWPSATRQMLPPAGILRKQSAFSRNRSALSARGGYPLMGEMHAASSLESNEEVGGLARRHSDDRFPAAAGSWFPFSLCLTQKCRATYRQVFSGAAHSQVCAEPDLAGAAFH